MANIKEQNVFFKSGSQAKYDALTSRDAGTFYVTHDTHRLYLGNDLLSQAVEIVKEIPQKTDPRAVSGTIFYIEGKNILAIFDKTANEWVQLNPDTRITDMDLSTSTAADGTTELSLIVTENRHTDNNASDNTFSQKIKFSGARGITVTPNAGGDGLIITAPELTVGTTTGGAQIGLDTKVVPIVGEGSTAVSYDSEAGKIKISSSYENTKVTGGSVTVTPSLPEETGFDVIVQVQSKTNDSNPQEISLGTGKLNPIIKVATGKDENGLAYNGSDIKFKDGIAKVDTYSTAYLDKKFQDTLNQVNAMTYKGKLDVNGGIATLPSLGVHIGDTYILPEAAQVNGSGTTKSYQPGTLFIAKGTEGADGIITSDLSFDSVLTSDSDTTYTLVNDTANALSFYSSTDRFTTPQSLIEIAGDNCLTATITSEASNNAHATISVNHKDLGFTETKDASKAVTQESGKSKTFTVVDSIVQEKGHITSLTTKDITVVDTVTKLTEADFGAKIQNGAAVIDLAINDNQGGAASSKFNIASDTLTLTADANTTTVRAELVWGSFDE